MSNVFQLGRLAAQRMIKYAVGPEPKLDLKPQVLPLSGSASQAKSPRVSQAIRPFGDTGGSFPPLVPRSELPPTVAAGPLSKSQAALTALLQAQGVPAAPALAGVDQFSDFTPGMLQALQRGPGSPEFAARESAGLSAGGLGRQLASQRDGPIIPEALGRVGGLGRAAAQAVSGVLGGLSPDALRAALAKMPKPIPSLHDYSQHRKPEAQLQDQIPLDLTEQIPAEVPEEAPEEAPEETSERGRLNRRGRPRGQPIRNLLNRLGGN